ncbi:MAG: flavin reductase family protein [Candidatus Dormiibacterota bacterium]
MGPTAEDLKDAMARHAAGVAVVAASDDGVYRGLTATSLVTVSLDPPLLLVGVDPLTSTRDAIAAGRAFTVSLLERRQEFLAERFAAQAPPVDARWAEVRHRVLASGLPVLEGAIAWFDCALEDLRPAGDHELALGRIREVGIGSGEPLVHWDRSVWALG